MPVINSIHLEDVTRAHERILDHIVRTPLLYSPQLSETAGVELFLKCENLQRTGSFKLRGAMNRILALSQTDADVSGVITASSGNHGQAVAYAARTQNLPCTVVVPETVLAVKERAILSHGASVIHCGTTSSERITLAQSLAVQQGLVYIPPYDDPYIAAGQGTIGLEILLQCPDVKTVYVPIGGGGLISGIATALKESREEIRVIGVEPESANDTYLSMRAGEIQDIGETSTIADGLRTSHPGHYTFPIVQQHVNDVALVSEDEIKQSVVRLLGDDKLLVEPSGSTSVAGALKTARSQGGPVVCVLSGGNVDLDLVAELVR